MTKGRMAKCVVFSGLWKGLTDAIIKVGQRYSLKTQTMCLIFCYF